jgi:hypothetical protein
VLPGAAVAAEDLGTMTMLVMVVVLAGHEHTRRDGRLGE